MDSKIDFDQINNRRDTNSYKWDSSDNEDIIPMWVADMDFKTAPAIIDVLRERVEQGIFGYTKVPFEYYKATIDWFMQRHSWRIEKDWIIYTSGVVPAISAIIKALTNPGDEVIIMTPVYNCFFSSIRNNGCVASENSLIYKDKTYYIDFEDLERRAKSDKAKILLLCNPHNPTGRVWTPDELTQVSEICLRHGVIVVSDEIHCELVFEAFGYTPFASLNPSSLSNSVTCVSPSKAFNIAGLQIANIICENAERRALIDKAININEVCDVNPFGVLATIAAYTKGEDWLNQLMAYLWENYQTLCEFFEENFPDYPVTKLEGTYLVWVDCRKLKMSSDSLEHELMEKAHVWLNSGSMYGKDGEGFMRINIACPRSRLLEGLNRLKQILK